MTKNLEAADRITKLTLALMTLIFYLFDVIQGPFARALMIVSVAVLLIYFVKIVFLKDD
jgi:hypothetical protein